MERRVLPVGCMGFRRSHADSDTGAADAAATAREATFTEAAFAEAAFSPEAHLDHLLSVKVESFVERVASAIVPEGIAFFAHAGFLLGGVFDVGERIDQGGYEFEWFGFAQAGGHDICVGAAWIRVERWAKRVLVDFVGGSVGGLLFDLFIVDGVAFRRPGRRSREMCQGGARERRRDLSAR